MNLDEKTLDEKTLDEKTLEVFYYSFYFKYVCTVSSFRELNVYQNKVNLPENFYGFIPNPDDRTTKTKYEKIMHDAWVKLATRYDDNKITIKELEKIIQELWNLWKENNCDKNNDSPDKIKRFEGYVRTIILTPKETFLLGVLSCWF
jgi:hypothetical protein